MIHEGVVHACYVQGHGELAGVAEASALITEPISVEQLRRRRAQQGGRRAAIGVAAAVPAAEAFPCAHSRHGIGPTGILAQCL